MKYPMAKVLTVPTPPELAQFAGVMLYSLSYKMRTAVEVLVVLSSWGNRMADVGRAFRKVALDDNHSIG